MAHIQNYPNFTLKSLKPDSNKPSVVAKRNKAYNINPCSLVERREGKNIL